MSSPPKLPPMVGRTATSSLPVELQPPPTEVSTSSSDDDEDAPPPEIVTAATARLVESLGAMVRDRWGHEKRRHPHMQFPLELMEGMDINWSVRYPVKTHGRFGHKSLAWLGDKANFMSTSARSRDPTDVEPVIDSPRSAVVLIRNGFSGESVRADVSDALTSKRRFRTSRALIAEYTQFTREVSSAFIVRALRGEVDPTLHVGSPPSARDPERQHQHHHHGPISPTADNVPGGSRPATAMSVKPLRKPVTSNMVPTRAKRCKPQDLQRLQRHRSAFTSDWGAKQQAIATDTFRTEKVKQLKDAHVSEVRKRAAVANGTPTRGGVSSPARSATVTETSSPVRSPKAGGGRDPPTVSLSESGGGRGGGGRGDRSPGRVQEAAVMSRMAKVREESRRKEEQRRQAVEQALAAKAEKAEAAAQAKRQQRNEWQRVQRSRTREAQEVVERMNRAAQVRRMQVITAVEQDAAAKETWSAQQEEARRQNQLLTKERRTLNHRTRTFIERASVAIEKATAQQELAVDADIAQQRLLKDESRTKLVRLLQEEDALVDTWARFEARNDSPPRPATTEPRSMHRRTFADSDSADDHDF